MKVTLGVLGVLEKGAPKVEDLVIFVYSQGHMGRGLEALRVLKIGSTSMIFFAW